MVPHCDVVAIFAPNFARVEVVEELVDAVKAGAPLKGVICEKPFARTCRSRDGSWSSSVRSMFPRRTLRIKFI